MEIIQFIKLIRKNLLLLILVPIILAGLVYYGTQYQDKYYVSSATIYTGLGSGLTLEAQENSRVDYTATRMELDNILNLFKSREIQQEVALSLFIQGLGLKSWNPQFMSRQSYDEFQELVPQYIKDMDVRPGADNFSNYIINVPLILNDTIGLKNKQLFTKNRTYKVQTGESLYTVSSKLGVSASDLMKINTLTSTNLKAGTELIYEREEMLIFSKDNGINDTIPIYIPDPNYYLLAENDSLSFAQTLKLFKEYYADNDTNYIYKLLNHKHKYYSIKAINELSARQVQGSDLLRLAYRTTDPGICKQTLQFSIDAFERNYKKLKENQSDNVVKYFEDKVTETSINLQAAENRLLKFNQIIMSKLITFLNKNNL
jgi:hypothetical protein